MSNLWFNIRFGIRHWQWGPDGMTWRVNPAHVGWRNQMPETWKWFAVYCAFGKHFGVEE
jgi:hypothetical protein